METTSTPKDYHTLTPSIVVHDGAAAIKFYQSVFGATAQHRMETPDGKIMHAELLVGDSKFMLSDEAPDWGALSPASIGGTAVTLHLYVENVDATFDQAVAAGSEALMPVADQFWGDRSGSFKDPFGHKWMVAKRIEEVPEEEMERRSKEWMQKEGC